LYRVPTSSPRRAARTSSKVMSRQVYQAWHRHPSARSARAVKTPKPVIVIVIVAVIVAVSGPVIVGGCQDIGDTLMPRHR
jgi:hypothetical protein